MKTLTGDSSTIRSFCRGPGEQRCSFYFSCQDGLEPKLQSLQKQRAAECCRRLPDSSLNCPGPVGWQTQEDGEDSQSFSPHERETFSKTTSSSPFMILLILGDVCFFMYVGDILQDG